MLRKIYYSEKCRIKEEGVKKEKKRVNIVNVEQTVF
jgi:hypothetical protein